MAGGGEKRGSDLGRTSPCETGLYLNKMCACRVPTTITTAKIQQVREEYISYSLENKHFIMLEHGLSPRRFSADDSASYFTEK